MKYTRGQFTSEYYKMWELGVLLPTPDAASIYSVKYRKNVFDEYARVTLKALSVGDALERACYSITYGSPWRPEDIDLHAVYDGEENLLWIDEPYYDIVQKKHEFRGMERREFLARFGATSAAILFGIRPQQSFGATTAVALSGTAIGFAPPGEQSYTTPGGYNWTAPAGVTSVCAICIGGGAGGGYSGGGGGGLGWRNSMPVVPGNSYVVNVGRGAVSTGSPPQGGDTSYFNAVGVQVIGSPGSGNSGGGYTGDGGGNGGSGGSTGGGGGGGAGGYSGGGGSGYIGGGSNGYSSTGNGSSGSGGGGGGGGSYIGNAVNGCGGGGVGLFGQGSNGAGGIGSTSQGGGGGSGGSAGGNCTSVATGSGGAYGGGGGGLTNGVHPGGNPYGGHGAVRIIWGIGRSFPSNAT